MITKKFYKMIRVSYADSDLFRITNISDEVGHFSIIKNGTPNATLEYSLNGVDWISYDMTNLPTVSVNPKSNIYLKGKSNVTINSHRFGLSFDKDYNIGGNILSIIDNDNKETITTLSDYKLYGFFSNQTHLISSSNMNIGNVTTLSGGSFERTFEGCTSMVDSPNLSSLTSANIHRSFSGCTSLVVPPDFSNITSGSFDNAFSGCTSLVVPPDFSGLTILGGNSVDERYTCRQLFDGCTSLSTPPDFSNLTSAGQYCFYGAFYDCTSLTESPNFSNVTSAYASAFESCFRNSSVNKVYAPNLSELRYNVFQNWLDRVPSTGILYCPSQTVADLIPNDSVHGCPTGWTKQLIS